MNHRAARVAGGSRHFIHKSQRKLSSRGGSWRDVETAHGGTRAGVQADMDGARTTARCQSKPVGLNEEMVGLRLRQLWSHCDAVQDYKGGSLLPEASYHAGHNGYSEDEDEEDGDAEAAAASSPNPSPVSP